ncbi:MAG: TonB-dependent receptor [Gammaproteobacteria bacterium]|nr:TonB-dependent receptor [Gammaproteobacteria bacterium]
MCSSIGFVKREYMPVLAAIATVACSPAVLAQDASEASLEEIIVTAQKRDQALADIPMSVTVVSGDMLEELQADNFQDMVALIPGLSITTGRRGVTRLTLRGANTGGVASTVGVYLGDVPFGSSTGLANGSILSGDFDTFDMNRIEVLRGPQGTLYGASSLGGVLKYVPNAPSTDGFKARIKASAEDVDGADTGTSVTGALNIPASDTVAIRASGFYRKDEGYVNSIGNNPIPSLTDPNNNVVDGTLVIEGLNSVDTTGGRLAVLFKPSETFSLTLAAHTQDIESGGTDVVDADAVTLQPLGDGRTQSRYHRETQDITYRVYSASLDWDLDAVTLESVTSSGEFEQTFINDIAIGHGLTGGTDLAALVTLLFGDPVALPLSAILPQTTATDKLSQEFRLVSADSDTFEWLAGLYYTEEESVIIQDILAVDAGTDNVAAGLPALAEIRLDSEYEEIAVFANATWYVSPRFEMSFGARWSDNEQIASQAGDGPLAGGPTLFDGLKSSESPFTWSLSPRWKLNDESSLYFRVATGFRPGGPNVLPPNVPPGTPLTYEADRLTSYELGYKMTSSSGRFALDAAAYLLDWEDIQLFAVVNNFGVNANGGTAESKGLEFSASLLPTDGLRLSLNGAYTDAYLTQATDPIIGGLDGDPLSYVPEWSFGLDAEYEWDVMGDKTAYFGGNLGYTGDRPAGFDNRDGNGSIREAASFTTLNLRAGIDAGRWSLQMYARNLTDEEGINSIDDVGSLPNGAAGLSFIRPRAIGISLGASFGD